MGRASFIAVGFGLGLALACGRAPLGLDWVGLAAVEGPRAAAVRAAALALVAVVMGVLARGGAPLRAGAWLGGLFAGFATGALLLDGWFAPQSTATLGIALVAPTFAAILVGMRAGALRAPRTLTVVGDPPPARDGLGALECAGIVLCGVGAAIALETVARPLRSLGLGTAIDDAAAGTIFLALVWIGALGFGPALGTGATRVGARLFGPVLVALGAFVGWWFLGRFEEPGALGRQLALFGARAIEQGTWRWSLAVAAPVLIVPALLLGMWCAAASDMRRIGALAAGAALGLVALVWLREGWAVALAGPDARESLAAHRGLSIGALVAAAGAALAAFGHWRAGGRPSAPIGAVLLAAVTVSIAPGPLLLLSPWQDTPIEAEWVLETSDGLFTVETTRFGETVATLDRRLLVPPPWDRAGDAERLAAAVGAVGTFALSDTAPRILFVGLLTRERAAVLTARPGLVLERTSPWYPHGDFVEASLNRGTGPLPGRVVAPREARRRIHAGHYDLVLAPAAYGVLLAPRGLFDTATGPAPTAALGGLELPAGTAGVAWLDGGSEPGAASLSASVLVQARGLDDPHVAFLAGEARHWPRTGEAGLRAAFAAIAPRSHIPGILHLFAHPRTRVDQSRARLFRRLADAAAVEPSASADLARALALHYAAQRLSPTWATAPEGSETDPASYALFAAAARALAPDPFVERSFEAFARLLVEKQEYEDVLEHVLPVAEAKRPWLALERALVDTYRALLAGDEALARIELLLERRPGDPDLWLERGELELELGVGDAAASLRRALELQPEGYERRRRLALGLLGVNDPGARDLVRELLQENPFDASLRDSMRAAPTPR